MLNLLKKDYPAHYNTRFTGQVSLWETDMWSFEIIDKDGNKGNPIICDVGLGDAAFLNQSGKKITFINIDAYFTYYKKKRAGEGKRCDLLWYTEDKSVFSLTELTRGFKSTMQDTTKEPNKWDKAHSQLLESAERLLAVPTIKAYIETFGERNLIFFYRFNEEKPRENPLGESSGDMLEDAVNTFLAPQTLNRELTMIESPVEGFDMVYKQYPDKFVIE